MSARGMSAEEADDVISELGTAEVARRYGWERPANDEHANDDGSVVARPQKAHDHA